MVKRALILACIASAICVPASSRTRPAKSAPRITSAYTNIYGKGCKTTVEYHEEYGVDRCPGFAGIPIFIQDGDNRTDISAGVDDGGEDFCGMGSCAFNEPAPTVEWRLSNGKPFAIIYRLIVGPTDTGNPKLSKSSVLIVETIGKGSCRIARIAGDIPKANVAAREAADLVPAGDVRCIDIAQEQREVERHYARQDQCRKVRKECAWEDRWSATSKTAVSITGDITLSSTHFRAAGQDFQVEPAADLPHFGGGSGPVAARVLMVTQKKDPKLLNGNRLGCGHPMRWIAFWRSDQGETLNLATFDGPELPSSVKDPSLCGTFTYSNPVGV